MDFDGEGCLGAAGPERKTSVLHLQIPAAAEAGPEQSRHSNKEFGIPRDFLTLTAEDFPSKC